MTAPVELPTRYLYCMKLTKNTITVMLVASSILLLLVLQLFWLQNSYEKAYFDLRRDTNFLFRNALFSLRDSIIARNIQPLPSDPSEIKALELTKGVHGDSMRFTMKSSTVQVFVNATGSHDSIVKALGPMAQTLQQKGQDGRSFIIRLAPDTISLDTLKLAFDKALQEAGQPLQSVVRHEAINGERTISFRSRFDFPGQQRENELNHRVYGDTIYLDPVRLNPATRYHASLVDIREVLLKEITPQILFSLFLTGLTLLAFVVLYKNLRTQQRLMEQKNDFISNVTHELKTPVATVSVALEALKNFHGLDDPKRTQEYLEIAQNELNRLTLMTDKILKAAAFENKGVIIQKESVDLKELVGQIIDSMKLVFEKNQAKVSFQPHGNNFLIDGSLTHITNVIYNLLDNALKYSPNHPQLVITLKESTNEVVLSVRDNGIGIPEEFKKKIFEKFFRIPAGDIHTVKGYGLGLSYVASVVHEHGGTIEVVSEPGKGSTFIIHLPRNT